MLETRCRHFCLSIKSEMAQDIMANSSSTDNNMRSDQPEPAAMAADSPGFVPLEFHLIAPCAFFVCVFVLGQYFAAQCNIFWKLLPCVLLLIVLLSIVYAWSLACQSTFWEGLLKTAKVIRRLLFPLSFSRCLPFLSPFSLCLASNLSSE